MVSINKEQKTALSFLLLSKVFERLAFYLIMANLTFYLTETFQVVESKAGLFYSLFYGSVGLSAIVSGILGDYFNRLKVVKLGMFLMTVLYLVLIFLPVTYILQLTIFIALGVSIGMTISNTIVFIGNIYNEQKTQTFGLSGFIFYSLVISIGAFIAPLLSNLMKESIGYKPIFIVAFGFAFISFMLYLLFDKNYSKLELFAEQRKNNEPNYKKLNILILLSVFVIGIVLKTALYQKNITLSFYFRDFVESGRDFATRLDNIDKFISVILLSLFGIITVKLKKLNWNKILSYILYGSILGSLSYALFATIKILSTSDISQFLSTNIYSILLVSETLIYPTILYVVYRSSPLKLKGLFQGISLLIISVSNTALFIGPSLYEKASPSIAFFVFSLILLFGASLVFFLMKIVKRKEKELEEIVI